MVTKFIFCYIYDFQIHKCKLNKKLQFPSEILPRVNESGFQSINSTESHPYSVSLIPANSDARQFWTLLPKTNSPYTKMQGLPV